jgi:hypothetical protein
MLTGRRTAAMRTTGSYCPEAAPIVQLGAAKRFNALAVARNCEALLEWTCQRYGAGLPPDLFTAEHRALAPHAASNAELCS